MKRHNKNSVGVISILKYIVPLAALLWISLGTNPRTVLECEKHFQAIPFPRPGKAAVLQALAYAERAKYLANDGDFEAMRRTVAMWNELNLCNKENVIVVGGTNAGQASYNILSSCPEISFYGFEIQKQYYNIAKSNLTQFRGATILNMGWSDVVQSDVRIGGKGGLAGLYDPRGQRRLRLTNQTVSTVRLSDWAADTLGSRNILYLLIDVEGHEPKVIRGMQLEEPRNRQRFSMFQYELGGTWAERDNRHGGSNEWSQFDTAKFLEQNGYSLFLLGTDDLLLVDSDFFREDGNIAMEDESYGKFIQGNLLALHTHFAPQAIVSAVYASCRTKI